uniref:Uncharacterized protein n=2 Tax=Aegilops tauschii subsp. strangulata TaxID=200361 RepID=A0A453PSM6_AEGTS
PAPASLPRRRRSPRHPSTTSRCPLPSLPRIGRRALPFSALPRRSTSVAAAPHHRSSPTHRDRLLPRNPSSGQLAALRRRVVAGFLAQAHGAKAVTSSRASAPPTRPPPQSPAQPTSSLSHRRGRCTGR